MVPVLLVLFAFRGRMFSLRGGLPLLIVRRVRVLMFRLRFRLRVMPTPVSFFPPPLRRRVSTGRARARRLFVMRVMSRIFFVRGVVRMRMVRWVRVVAGGFSFGAMMTRVIVSAVMVVPCFRLVTCQRMLRVAFMPFPRAVVVAGLAVRVKK